MSTIIVIALFLFPTLPPMPREAAKHEIAQQNTQTGDAQTQKANTTHKPNLKPEAKPEASQNAESGSGCEQSDDPAKGIAVEPVTVTKDDLDRGYIGATIVIAFVTLTLAAIASVQAFVAWRTLIATHRPKLIIRGVALIPGTIVPTVGVQDALNWEIHLMVANIGSSPAKVKESNLTITRIEPVDGMLPAFPPYNADRNSLGQFLVKPGEHKPVQIKLDEDTDTMRFRILRHVKAGGGEGFTDLYCLGFLQYEDRAKIRRRTAFCLRYDSGSERFLRVNNPDYDYAD